MERGEGEREGGEQGMTGLVSNRVWVGMINTVNRMGKPIRERTKQGGDREMSGDDREMSGDDREMPGDVRTMAGVDYAM